MNVILQPANSGSDVSRDVRSTPAIVLAVIRSVLV